MSIFLIESNDVRADGSRVFMNVETNLHTLRDLAEAPRLGPVVVHQLFTSKSDEPGVLEVRDRREFLLTWSYVFCAHVPNKRFVEYAADAEAPST